MTDLIRKAISVAGLANALGGILVAVAYVLHPHHGTPEVIGSSFWFWIHLTFAASLLFGLFGLLGLLGYHADRISSVGLSGFVLAFLSLTLIFGLNFFEWLINPVLAAEAPAFVEKYGAGETIGLVRVIFPVTGALFVIGYVCLGTDLLRRSDLAKGGSILTMAGVVVFGAGLGGFLPMAVVQVGSVLFGAGLVWLGLSLFRAPQTRP